MDVQADEPHVLPPLVADAGERVGKRHRRIRARGTSGPVAGAATEKHGLAAHRANGLPSLRSPKEPLVPERPTLRLEPDAQLTRTQGAVSWPEKRHSAHCYSEAHEWRVPLALSSPAARQLEAGFGRPNALRRDCDAEAPRLWGARNLGRAN